MDFFYLEDLYKYVLNSKIGGIMVMVEVLENVLNFLIKSFEIEDKIFVNRRWKVREREDKKLIWVFSMC